MNKMTNAVIECQKFNACMGYILGGLVYGPERYPVKKFDDKLEIRSEDITKRTFIVRISPPKQFEEKSSQTEEMKVDIPHQSWIEKVPLERSDECIIHSLDNEML